MYGNPNKNYYGVNDMTFQVIATLLSTISSLLTRNGEDKLAVYVELVAALVNSTGEVQQELEQLNAELAEMVETGSEPTEEQLDDVALKRDELIAQLEALRTNSAE
jgi:septal ring factor EnvC (AmiA/AmiB activator)